MLSRSTGPVAPSCAVPDDLKVERRVEEARALRQIGEPDPGGGARGRGAGHGDEGPPRRHESLRVEVLNVERVAGSGAVAPAVHDDRLVEVRSR